MALHFFLLPSCLCKPLSALPGERGSIRNSADLHMLVSQSWPARETPTKPSPTAPSASASLTCPHQQFKKGFPHPPPFFFSALFCLQSFWWVGKIPGVKLQKGSLSFHIAFRSNALPATGCCPRPHPGLAGARVGPEDSDTRRECDHTVPPLPSPVQ